MSANPDDPVGLVPEEPWPRSWFSAFSSTSMSRSKSSSPGERKGRGPTGSRAGTSGCSLSGSPLGSVGGSARPGGGPSGSLACSYSEVFCRTLRRGGSPDTGSGSWRGSVSSCGSLAHLQVRPASHSLLLGLRTPSLEASRSPAGFGNTTQPT